MVPVQWTLLNKVAPGIDFTDEAVQCNFSLVKILLQMMLISS